MNTPSSSGDYYREGMRMQAANTGRRPERYALVPTAALSFGGITYCRTKRGAMNLARKGNRGGILVLDRRTGHYYDPFTNERVDVQGSIQ